MHATVTELLIYVLSSSLPSMIGGNFRLNRWTLVPRRRERRNDSTDWQANLIAPHALTDKIILLLYVPATTVAAPPTVPISRNQANGPRSISPTKQFRACLHAISSYKTPCCSIFPIAFLTTSSLTMPVPCESSSSPASKEQEQQLPCPRCESNNTKFCYYNNYNSAQPRYFCKACRRYWTQGGALRNIPVGGGTRKASSNKRTRTAPEAGTVPAQLHSNTSYTYTTTTPLALPPQGSFTSLLNSQVLSPDFVGLGFFDNMGLVGLEGGAGLCWSNLMNTYGNGSSWLAENECSVWQPTHAIPSAPTKCLKWLVLCISLSLYSSSLAVLFLRLSYVCLVFLNDNSAMSRLLYLFFTFFFLMMNHPPRAYGNL